MATSKPVAKSDVNGTMPDVRPPTPTKTVAERTPTDEPAKPVAKSETPAVTPNRTANDAVNAPDTVPAKGGPVKEPQKPSQPTAEQAERLAKRQAEDAKRFEGQPVAQRLHTAPPEKRFQPTDEQEAQIVDSRSRAEKEGEANNIQPTATSAERAKYRREQDVKAREEAKEQPPEVNTFERERDSSVPQSQVKTNKGSRKE